MTTERKVKCDYCGNPARLVAGARIYPQKKESFLKKFWQCVPCEAYVGCHRDSDYMPLGRLANAELRAAKRAAHVAFDPIWRNAEMRRPAAYSWLALQLGIPECDCHIGMFNVEMCRKVIDVMAARKK